MDSFPNKYAQDVNNTARGSFGTFLTTGTKEQYPKEHDLLVAACTEAHKALGPQGQSVRPMNFIGKLNAFENDCVGPVKSIIMEFVDKQVFEEDVAQSSPKFSPLLAQFKSSQDSIFPWASMVLFACMKNYHDSIELKKMKESMQSGYGRGGYTRGNFPSRGGGRQEYSGGRHQGEGGGGHRDGDDFHYRR